MERHTLPILAFLLVVLVVSHAAVPPEMYWKKVLPNTPMPKAIRNSLPDSEWTEDKSTSVYVGKGGVRVNVDPHKGKPNGNGGHTHVNVGPKGGVGVGGHTNVGVSPKGGVGVTIGKPGGGGHTNVNVGPKHGVGVSTGKPGGGHTSVNVGPKGGVGVSTGKPGKGHVYVGVKPGPDPFSYLYAASETQLHDDPSHALFFLAKDMKPGSQMTLSFPQSTNDATFLPRDEAESIPFSSDKMSNILQAYSIRPGSEVAHVVEDTIKECEAKGIQGEQKYCATSLESMVDYATSTIGKNVRAISTEVKGDDNKKKYTITRVKKVARYDQTVASHKKSYPYAVFYCHRTKATSTFIVTLAGIGGSRAEAVVVCHKDTSAWNPKHLAFKVLNVQPGSVPICHFLPEDHIVWVSN